MTASGTNCGQNEIGRFQDSTQRRPVGDIDLDGSDRYAALPQLSRQSFGSTEIAIGDDNLPDTRNFPSGTHGNSTHCAHPTQSQTFMHRHELSIQIRMFAD